MIDAACEQNYKMISDTRDYFKLSRHSEREVLHKTLEGLKADEKIINALSSGLIFKKWMRGKIQKSCPWISRLGGEQ